MVQTLLNLTSKEDMVVNVIKGKFGLRNKNDAIRLIINKYEEELLEPQLKPEYTKKLRASMSEKGVRFKSMDAFDKHFENA
jgi:hypothetical protein